MACIILWLSVSWKDGKLQICTFTIKSEGLHLCKLWKRTEFSAAKKLWLVSFSKVIFIPRCFVFRNGLFVYQIFFSSLKICNWGCCDWKEEKNQSASEVQHACRSGGLRARGSCKMICQKFVNEGSPSPLPAEWPNEGENWHMRW